MVQRLALKRPPDDINPASAQPDDSKENDLADAGDDHYHSL